jgi:hypothetical protein
MNTRPPQLAASSFLAAPPITLAAPQFQAQGYDGLVYDLYDIRDMLKHLNSDGMTGHELVAKRRTQIPG